MEDITQEVSVLTNKKEFRAYLDALEPGIYTGRMDPRLALVFKGVCWDYSVKSMAFNPNYVRPGGSKGVPSDRYPVALYLMDAHDKGLFELRAYHHVKPTRVGFSDGREKEGSEGRRELKEKMAAMKDGDSFFWKCPAKDVAYIRIIASNMGVSAKREEGGLRISKGALGESSAKSEIMRLCATGGGPLPSGVSPAYARAVVSVHNGSGKEKMSVRISKSGFTIEPYAGTGQTRVASGWAIENRLPKTIALMLEKGPFTMTQEDFVEVKTELQALLNWIKECMAK